MTKQELMEIVADIDVMDLPDGAHFAMLEELTGMEAIEVYLAIDEAEYDEEHPTRDRNNENV